MVAEGQPLALPQLTEPSPGLVLLLGCATDDRPVESWRAARVYRIGTDQSADSADRDIFGDIKTPSGTPPSQTLNAGTDV